MQRLCRICAISAALFSQTSIHALDFGLDLSNNSMVSYDSMPLLSQSNRASPWLKVPLGPDAKLYVSGFYEFSAAFQVSPDFKTISPVITPLRIDLDRTDYVGSLSAVFGKTSLLSYAFGRTNFSDTATQVISGLSDGASAELAIGNISYKASLGYRGLLYKADARSYIDSADAAIDDAAVSFTSLNSYVASYFAPQRAFVGIGAFSTELARGLDIGFEGWGQIDVAGLARLKIPTHTLYLEPSASIKFTRLLGWKIWGVYEIGYSTGIFPSFAFGSQFDLSLPQYMGLRLSQNTLFASGNSGVFRTFTPIRMGSVGSVAALPFSDVASVSLESFLSPLSGLYCGLSAIALFRASNNVPSKGSVRADASGPYLGFETNMLLASYPTSDLMLSMGLGVYVPNTVTMFVKADSPTKFTLSVSAILSM
ncbi:MAG: hypothetical protein WCQ50_00230 [Spirochaetota bacterium]